MTSLGALLAPAPTADLASTMSERRRLFVRVDDPQRFRDLLPWAPVLLRLVALRRLARERFHAPLRPARPEHLQRQS